MRRNLAPLLLLSLSVLVAGATEAAAQLATAEEKGLPTNSTFAGGDVDVVNLQNGNLHISIPIYVDKQRGGKTLQWSLAFDSQTFLKKFTAYTCTGNPNGICNPPGYYGVIPDPAVVSGWRLISPQNWTAGYGQRSTLTCPFNNLPYSVATDWTVQDPQGTIHQLPLRQEFNITCQGSLLKGPTLDGSGITYDSVANIIYLKDGTQIGNGEIRDTNGNLYTFSNNKDTNGRTPVTTTTGPNIMYTTPLGVTMQGPSYTKYTVLDSGGNSQVYTVAYEAIDVNTTFCNEPFGGGGLAPCAEDGSANPFVIQSVTLPDGKAYSFTYVNNASAQINSMTLPTGATISYTYGTFVQIQPSSVKAQLPNYVGGPSVTSRTVSDDGTSQLWSYVLSPDGSSNAVTDPVGNVTTHSFNAVSAPGNTETPTNSKYETSVTYKDSSGNLLRTVVTAYTAEFNDTTNLPANIRPISVTTTLDNGQVMQKQTDYETFDYYGSEVATRLNPTEERVYDYGASAPGSLIRKTDYTYLHTSNTAYATLNIVDRPLTVVVSNGAGATAAQTKYEYDNYSHGNQTFTASNAIQHDSTFTTSYTTRGNVTAVSKWRSTDGVYLTSTNQYDDAGNVLSVIDPLGRQTFTSYTDSWGSNSACVPTGQTAAFPTKITNAKGQSVSSTYNACTGSTSSTTDENSKTTTSTYDFMGRLKVVTPPAGGGTKTYCYSDDINGLCYSTSSLYSTETDALSSSINQVVTTLHDSLGRVKEVQSTSDPDGVVYVDTQYDQDGRAYKVSNPYRTGDTVYWTTNGYDGLGRVTSMTKADASATSTVYTGNTTTVADEAGNKRKSQTNVLGQLTGVWEDPAGVNYETDYAYDVLGNMQQATQKGGDSNSAHWRVRTFTYNSLSQLLCSANPETGSPSAAVATCPVTDTGSYIAGTTRYQYDNDGELTSKMAPLHNQTGTSTVVTTYNYDVLGRVLSKSYNDGTPNVSYAYDGTAITGCTPPTLTATNLAGHMSAMCDASGATVWSYDALGRTMVEKRTIGTVTDQISYAYFLNGAVNTVTYPLSGGTTPLVVTYSINTAGRTYSAVGSNGVTYGQVTSTWASGAAHVEKLGANIQITDTYNSRLQPMNTTAEQVSTTNTLFNRTYNFNLGSTDNGNLVGVQDGLDGLGLNRPNGSVNYTYDTLNRIKMAQTLGTACTAMAGGTLNWGSTYTVDPWGNLTAQTPTLCTAATLSSTATVRNQLAAATYDSAGNITLNSGQGYTYDAEGELVSGAGSSYTYDGMGERVKKPGKLYWKGVGSTALVETSVSDTSPTQYIFFNGARIARIDLGATTPKYYVTDNLGSTAVETDSLGNILNESLFFPYGVERVVIQNDTANNYKFTGKERDSETGLDDFGARYYASTLGRFMSPDWDAKPASVPYAKFGDPQTLNLYSYVENGPINNVDASGHVTGSNGLTQMDVPIPPGCESGINGGCLGSYIDVNGTPTDIGSVETATEAEENAENYQQRLADDAAEAQAQQQAPPAPTAQQQGGSSSTTSASTAVDAAKKAGGVLSTVKKWFGIGKTVADDYGTVKFWTNYASAIQRNYDRDTDESYQGEKGSPNVDLALLNYAKQNIALAGMQAAGDANGHFSSVMGALDKGIIQMQQLNVNAAWKNYVNERDAYFAQQAQQAQPVP